MSSILLRAGDRVLRVLSVSGLYCRYFVVPTIKTENESRLSIHENIMLHEKYVSMSSTFSTRDRENRKRVVMTYRAIYDETNFVWRETEGGSQSFEYGEMNLILRWGPSQLQVLESLFSLT